MSHKIVDSAGRDVQLVNLSAAAKLAGYSFYHMQTVVGKGDLQPATTYLDGVGKRLPLFLASDVVAWRDTRKRTTHTNKETRRGAVDVSAFLAGGGVIRKKLQTEQKG